MTVYARIETADRVTVVKFADESCDHGWAILRWLESEHPGDPDPERDRRWLEMKAAA